MTAYLNMCSGRVKIIIREQQHVGIDTLSLYQRRDSYSKS